MKKNHSTSLKESIKQVLVTGGAGYVGSVLVPKLIEKGYRVRVLDWYLFGTEVFNGYRGFPYLEEIQGDLRDEATVVQSLEGCDAVIHLACISNDPSFDLNPELGKSINYDAFLPLVEHAKKKGIKRFIYASSSSVYGIKQESHVTEDLPLAPLTDYSKYKMLCEEILSQAQGPGFTTVTLRPATVCGYSKRQRLDLIVNILTNHAYNRRKINIFGGSQLRPNIHIDDMTDIYVQALEWPKEIITGQVYNAGFENHSVTQLAEMVRKQVGQDVEMVTTPTDDIRSYHISSQKIQEELGYKPRKTIDHAIQDLLQAFQLEKIPNPLNGIRYYNVRTMKELGYSKEKETVLT